MCYILAMDARQLEHIRELFIKASEDDKWKLVANLYAQNGKLQEENRELKELAAMRNAVQYKPSSEQMQYFFPELELLVAEPEPVASRTVHVNAHDKAASRPRSVTSLPADTPVVVIDHTGDAPETKTENGVDYLRGDDRVVYKIAYVPARYIVEKHIWATYIPGDDENKRVVDYDNAALDSLSCSPSFAAQVVVSKMDDHLPLYRQSEMLQRDGVKISRQNMARWVIKYYKALRPLDDLMRRRIYAMPLVHKDETPVQVLDFKDDKGKPSTNTFMNVTVGSIWDREEKRRHTLVFYQCTKGRSIDVLLADVRRYDFKGYLLTDGLAGYNHFDASRHCSCWVHAVRGFKNILKADAGNETAQTIVKMVSSLYRIEQRWDDGLAGGQIDEEEFLAGRREEAGQQIDKIFAYVDERRGDYTQKSPTGKALAYIADRKEELKRHLEVVEGVLDNNIAERAIRPFTVGRGNWIFCKSQDGAEATAFFYSLVETAKACGLNPFDYLETVFTKAPALKEDEFDQLLPWNADMTILDSIRAERRAAQPDPDNRNEYFLSGGNGC